MNKLTSALAGLVLQLMLLPLLLWVPLMFAMAWLREALGDLTRAAALASRPRH